MGINDGLERLERAFEEVSERETPSGEEEPRASGADPAPLTTVSPGGEVPLPPVRRTDAVGLEAATAVAESLGLGFHLGSAVERIAWASRLGSAGVKPLREAVWLIERYVEVMERRPQGADLDASSARVARTGDAIEGLRAISAALESESMLRAEERLAPAPAIEQAAPEHATTVDPSAAPVSTAAADNEQSFGRELALMMARWVMITVSLIVVVLAVTLIAEWR